MKLTLVLLLMSCSGMNNAQSVPEYMYDFMKIFNAPIQTSRPGEFSVRFVKQKTSNEMANFYEEMKRSGIVYDYFDFFDTDSGTFDNISLDSLQRQIKFDIRRKKVPLDIDPEYLSKLINDIFQYPRNHDLNNLLKNQIGQYIFWNFGISGHITGIHTFKPKQFRHLYKNDFITGMNLFTIIPGKLWGTPEDSVILVGAHWDTVDTSIGYEDNGSGVAALMEILRAISDSNCSFKYSIIFVAFDLEEYGSQGSLLFIQEFLLPQILTKYNQTDFQGAYILDSIMNYNRTQGSQDLPNPVLHPKYYDFVSQNDQRGDFIHIIGRMGVDDDMVTNIQFHWRNKFKVTSTLLHDVSGIDVLPETQLLLNNIELLRSDHARFWYINNSEYYTSLKAILITDTGPSRGIMKACYHSDCDNPSFNATVIPFADLNFLGAVAKTLINVISESAQCSSDTVRYNDPISSRKYRSKKRIPPTIDYPNKRWKLRIDGGSDESKTDYALISLPDHLFSIAHLCYNNCTFIDLLRRLGKKT